MSAPLATTVRDGNYNTDPGNIISRSDLVLQEGNDEHPGLIVYKETLTIDSSNYTKPDQGSTGGSGGSYSYPNATSDAGHTFLVIGHTYTINTFMTGDNFSNMDGGLGNGSNGMRFTATGTIPINWTHGSRLFDITGVAPGDVMSGFFSTDGPWQSLGDGIITFVRSWYNIPADFSRPISVTKNYQSVGWVLNANTTNFIIDMNIVGWSRVVIGTCDYYYHNGPISGQLPAVATVQIYPFLNQYKQITDMGTGFPTGTVGGHAGLYTNNIATCFVTGSIARIIGNLHVVTNIFA